MRIGIGSEFGLSSRGGYRTSWRRRSEGGPPPGRVSFTANGRASLALAVKYARCTAGPRRDTVLLPAYLCHSMIQPLVELGLQVRFYPVESDLSIHLPEIYHRVSDRTLAVMLMHYFGFSQSGDPAASLARWFPSVVLLEDRTHLLLSDLHTGAVPLDSAIAVYSPRKWGPFPDLGIVVWPRQSHARALRACLPDKGYDWSFGFWRLLGLVLRALFFNWPIEALHRLSLWSFHRADAILDRRVQIRQASPLSRLLWRCWDWVNVWHVRRKNYQYLLDTWPVAHMEPLFKQLPASVCPLGFAIRTAKRDSLRQYLITKGVFSPIHWRRPPQVSPEEFPEAALLAEQELTIPIDQRYGLPHMEYIIEALCHA